MKATVPRQPGLDALPPYVPGKPIAELRRVYGFTDVMRLDSNENPLGPSPKVVAALAAALSNLNRYPDAEARALREGIAQRLAVRPDQIRVGNGADGVIREIGEGYVGEGDEVIVPGASFPNYDIATHIMRGKLVKAPLADFGLDLPAMLAAIGARTKVVFVCNPNNPTGTIVTARDLDAFVTQVPARVLVVIDEAYYEFVDSPDYPDALRYVREGRKNVIVLRTFSKVYGIAGIRLGYGVGEPEALNPLWTASDSFPVNLLAQVAGEAALEDDEFLRRTVADATGRAASSSTSSSKGSTPVHPQPHELRLCALGPGAPAAATAAVRARYPGAIRGGLRIARMGARHHR